jgi:hypothetical protein
VRTLALRGLTALAAAVLLATVLGAAASARNFSISNQTIRVTWRRLEFQEVAIISCPLTLEGSFHGRTFPKVARTLIGLITRATFAEASCTNGQVAARGVPWHLTYESFTGLLPNITALRILLAEFLWRITTFTRTCTYGTPADNILFSANINGTSEFTTLVPVTGRTTIHLLEGSLCPVERTFAGAAEDGNITLLNSSTRVRLTLI